MIKKHSNKSGTEKKPKTKMSISFTMKHTTCFIIFDAYVTIDNTLHYF